MSLRPFHLAIAVDDLDKAHVFYHKTLGFALGRKGPTWIDYDFFGHQLVTHLSPNDVRVANTNDVDGKSVPANHFGVILEWNQWHEFKERLVNASIEFFIEPYIRFEGEPGEQATMFFFDPARNALEFKAFKDDNAIFRT